MNWQPDISKFEKVYKTKSRICSPIPLHCKSVRTPKCPMFIAGKEVCFSNVGIYSSLILTFDSRTKSSLSYILSITTESLDKVNIATISLF